MRSISILILFVICSFNFKSTAQEKRAFQFDEFHKIMTISDKGISDNGLQTFHVLSPMQYGNPIAVVHDLKNDIIDTVERCKNVWFNYKGKWTAFLIEPSFQQKRDEKLKKRNERKELDDTLIIVVKNSDELHYKFPGVVKVIVPDEKDPELIVALVKNNYYSDTLNHENNDTILQDNANKKNKEIYRLLVFDPVTNSEHYFENVISASLSPYGKFAAFVVQSSDTADNKELHILNLRNNRIDTLFNSEGKVENISFSNNEERLTFIDVPDKDKPETYKLFIFNELDEIDRKHHVLEIMPIKGMTYNRHHKAYFTEDGNLLVSYLSYPAIKEPEDTLLKEEKYKLDIWSWDDDHLQPQQLVNLDREKKRGYRMIYDFNTGKRVQVEDSITRRAAIDRHLTNRYVLSFDNIKYARYITWDALQRFDIYINDLLTGDKRLILENHQGYPTLSPDGKYVIWYDRIDSSWISFIVSDSVFICLTCDIDAIFYNDEFDRPAPARGFGFSAWGDKGRYVLLNSKYNIWKIDLESKKEPVCMTCTSNQNKQNIVYRLQRVDPKKFIWEGNDKLTLRLFNRETKESGYAKLQYNRPGRVKNLIYSDHRFTGLRKSRNSNKIIWHKENFNEFPELWVSNLRFYRQKQLSNAGKQYDKFYRGNVSLVSWEYKENSYEGLYYLPENMSDTSKIPMIVTFYERGSNLLHRFNHFSPSRSVINIPHYLSHGYAVFQPDIHYSIGTPGDDALQAVVSGTNYILSLGDVDSNKIGIQGQSWGGYQVAYIITQTDMFTAAMAGAPVSNMTSAYGAIRKASGRSRMFQYEMGQSRIGKTLWNGGLDKYINNSPLFFADNINTPLLVMHNDNDGAVPWSQSVELFLALRRMNKPSWLLVYNNEAHNLRRWPNRVDLSIRMKQFFDHYLKDEPVPKWMCKGIPATKKNLIDGYELIKK